MKIIVLQCSITQKFLYYFEK